MTLAKIAKTILKKKPKSGKPISENKKKANELLRKASRIMGQAMKPEMRRAKKEQAEALRAKANKLLMNEKAAGGIIKKGAKAVVKRGRKSKRGRPKKKVETPVVTKKKQDPFKIKKLPGESDAAFKKRKASITKLRKQQEKELAKEKGTKLPSTKGRTEKSMTKPPLKKEMSKARRRRLVMQRLMGTNPKTGESKDIGRMGYPTSETMRDLGYTGSRKGGIDLTDKELEALGFQIKKVGGKLKPPPNPGAAALPEPVRNKMGFMKAGGKVQKRAGGGVALRGFGVTRKK
jgi:hypothetical protein